MTARLPTRTAPRRGFTLIEVLVATALLGFSLIVMFGFHSQAVRSNREARKMTACTYLAQLELERLLSLPWDSTTRATDLADSSSYGDPTTASDPYAPLYHPNAGALPTPVNAADQTGSTLGQPIYYVTWDVTDMDSDSTYARIRVRCAYKDNTFNTWRGTTISTYRWRN